MRRTVENNELPSNQSDFILLELKRLNATQDKMADILSENTENLKLHMARTEANEKLISNLRLDVDPLKSAMIFLKGAFWALTVVGTILVGMQKLGIFGHLFGS